jgi:predicted O-linked N-acetylglucosamine transferase (SPINDLY family)
MSPDLNKNAVGMFSYALLNDYDVNRFEVYVLYTMCDEDMYTETLKNEYTQWFNVHDMTDQELSKFIRELGIDILVDLIACGTRNRLNTIAQRPAPIIINYIGFPSTGGSLYTHRIVDTITDPIREPMDSLCSEQLVRLNRCFLCFTLFKNTTPPDLTTPLHYTNMIPQCIHIGIMNKPDKWSKAITRSWEYIYKHCNNVVFHVKSNQEYTSSLFPHNVPYTEIPFRDTLYEYMMDYRNIDICLDTLPYSGTTTTCMSLLMGIPVITIYNRTNPHVSNVSASIMLHVDKTLFEPFICKDIPDYINCITRISKGELSLPSKHKVREVFISYMNHQLFTKYIYDEIYIELYDKVYKQT